MNNTAPQNPNPQVPPVQPVQTPPQNPPPPVIPASKPGSGNQTPKPDKKLPLKLIIGIIVFLLLAGGAAAGYIYREPLMQLVSKPSPTPAPIVTITPTPDPTANWQTYKNSEYGFEFKYPADFSPEFDQGSFTSINNDCVGAYCGSYDSMYFTVEGASTSDLLTWIKEVAYNEDHLDAQETGFAGKGDLCLTKAKYTQKEIGGKIAHSYTLSGNQTAHPGWCQPDKEFDENAPLLEEIYFDDGKSVYKFDLRYKRGSILETTYDQILSTFKFTNSQTIDTSNWKTFALADSNVVFSHPSSWNTSDIKKSESGNYFIELKGPESKSQLTWDGKGYGGGCTIEDKKEIKILGGNYELCHSINEKDESIGVIFQMEDKTPISFNSTINKGSGDVSIIYQILSTFKFTN